MASLYIHIPFCKQACTYCDFHFSTNLKTKNLLVNAIVQEVHVRHNYLIKKDIESIYFGGGTPSLLIKEEFDLIFNAIRTYFKINSDSEITLETNPDDISKDNLELWKELGFNRLSIGLQSFNNEELKWMNRAHNAEQSISSVLLAQDLGFNNITIDLIYGSKWQNLKTWENTLTKAVGLNTQHISSYNLTIENTTVLGKHFIRGKEPQINDDLSSKQFLLMTDLLKDYEFEHYEISNFAKPGCIAKHNSNYWLQKEYLGIGPSAHSFNIMSRQWNIKNNNLYIKSINDNTSFFEKEDLLLSDRFNEYVLTRLRTKWGCNTDEIKLLFGEKNLDHFLKIVDQKRSDFEVNGQTFTLKNHARLYADGIAADFFIN